MITKRVVGVLLISSMLGAVLFIVRSFLFDSLNYWYLNWNLFLAWIPLGLAYGLQRYTQTRSILSWQGIVLSGVLIGFMPNTFYIATDLIHLQDASNRTLFFDMAMITQFTFTGFWLGCISLYQLHVILNKQLKKYANTLVGFIIVLNGYAIYLGRFLRWNSWDIVTNPVGLVYDVSERFVNPSAYEQTYATTLLFAAIIATGYGLFLATMHAARESVLKTGHKG